jgi:RNA polymerase sigma-70 factor (ECF subfamily)
MVSAWLEDVRRNKLGFIDWDESERLEAHNSHAGTKIDLDAALSQLSPPVRLCVVLAYNEGLSHQEISDVTDIPLGTVKSNISRGSAKLRPLLSDCRKTR